MLLLPNQTGLCVHVHVLHVHVCAHVCEGQGTTSNVSHQRDHSFCETRSLIGLEIFSYARPTGQWAQGSFSVPAFQALELQTHATMLGFFIWVQGHQTQLTVPIPQTLHQLSHLPKCPNKFLITRSKEQSLIRYQRQYHLTWQWATRSAKLSVLRCGIFTHHPGAATRERAQCITDPRQIIGSYLRPLSYTLCASNTNILSFSLEDIAESCFAKYWR